MPLLEKSDPTTGTRAPAANGQGITQESDEGPIREKA